MTNENESDRESNVVSLGSFRKAKNAQGRDENLININRTRHNERVMNDYKKSKQKDQSSQPTQKPALQAAQNSDDLQERIDRIRMSITRINQLMSELRTANDNCKITD